MKKINMIIGGMIFIHTLGKSQAPKDSVENKIKKTDIELVYNHYIQDGDNSAVTGGKGTEELLVKASALKITRTKNKSSIGLQAGADVITSASVDNIDLLTKVSRVDTRTYANTSYQRTKESWDLSLGAGASIESDYTSISGKIGLTYNDTKKIASHWVLLQYYHDDLRWGRLNEQAGNKPVKLIYPVELRNKEWFDNHIRNSFNLKLGSSFAINKLNRLGLETEFGIQKGLLSTPFHRIFFNDNTAAVENLPGKRIKSSSSVKHNIYLTRKIILRNNVNYYQDSWDIKSLTLANETIFVLNRKLRLAPNVRLNIQSGTSHFKGANEHEPTDQFYTSDYDLSDFYSINVGLRLKYSPYSSLYKKWFFNKAILAYNYYQREDGLTAHILSVSFLLQH